MVLTRWLAETFQWAVITPKTLPTLVGTLSSRKVYSSFKADLTRFTAVDLISDWFRTCLQIGCRTSETRTKARAKVPSRVRCCIRKDWPQLPHLPILLRRPSTSSPDWPTPASPSRRATQMALNCESVTILRENILGLYDENYKRCTHVPRVLHFHLRYKSNDLSKLNRTWIWWPSTFCFHY